MQLPYTSSEYIMIPMTGPQDDLTLFSPYAALVPEDAGEPGDGDYKAAQWMNGEIALKVNSGDYAQGQYMVWGRVVTGTEDVRRPSGRIRIGDVRV